MKKQIAYLLVGASLAIIPATLTTGCAVTRGKESTKEYAKDKENCRAHQDLNVYRPTRKRD